MERLIGEFRSTYLAIPGGIGHFYGMQVALTHHQTEKRPAANLYALFHQDRKFWSNLCANMIDRPTYLAEMLNRPASDLGYTYDPDLGVGGV